LKFLFEYYLNASHYHTVHFNITYHHFISGKLFPNKNRYGVVAKSLLLPLSLHIGQYKFYYITLFERLYMHRTLLMLLRYNLKSYINGAKRAFCFWDVIKKESTNQNISVKGKLKYSYLTA
jgi:hypothetical protein